MIIVAPIAASLIQLAISRSREYEADATGAATTGNPYALARALQKLDAYSKRIPMQASPSNAHLFIVAPLLGSGGIASLFSTHPPMKETDSAVNWKGLRLACRLFCGPCGCMRWWLGLGGWFSSPLWLRRWRFISLPSAHEAGIVVGGTLRVLHWIGLIGGVVFCLATGWLWLWAEVPARVGFATAVGVDGGDAAGDGLLAVSDSAGDGGGSGSGRG